MLAPRKGTINYPGRRFQEREEYKAMYKKMTKSVEETRMMVNGRLGIIADCSMC